MSQLSIRRARALSMLVCLLPLAATIAAPRGSKELPVLTGEALPPSRYFEGRRGPQPDDSASLPGLTEIGFWMLSPDGGIARWLGLPFRARIVLEPVNVIIVDRLAKTEAEAVARFETASKAARFRERVGHSTGYCALIGGKSYVQMHAQEAKAFSDGPFIFANDHGRIFGPEACAGAFVFTGSFSREGASLFTLRHVLRSFNYARDRFADALEQTGAYRVDGFVKLGNAILGSPNFTTFDHDGVAVLLEASETPIASAGH